MGGPESSGLQALTDVAATLVPTQLPPPLLPSLRVAPGLSLKARRVLVTQSLPEVLTEAARTAAQALDWERDQEAWNLPHAQGESLARGADTAEPDATEGDPGERGLDPPAISPETTTE